MMTLNVSKYRPSRNDSAALWAIGLLAFACAKGQSAGEESATDSETSRDTEVSTDTTLPSDSETSFDTENLFTVNYQRADEIDPNAPGTIYIVTWSIRLPSVDKAEIRFGHGGAMDMSAPVDLKAPDYRTVLLGMRPASAYTFQIAADCEGTTYESETYEIETGPATNLVTVSSFTVSDETARERGFIVAAVGETAVIIGPDGEVV